MSLRRCVLCIPFLLTSTLHAAIEPAQVVIIANRQSTDSQAVAKYYANARNIPDENICYIDVKPSEGLGREEWSQKVRPYIRRWLIHRKLEATVRCFATVYDVPLKIGTVSSDDPINHDRLVLLASEKQFRIGRSFELIDRADSILANAPPEPIERKEDVGSQELAQLFNRALTDAQKRRAAETDPQKAKRASQEIEQLISQAVGPEGLLRLFKSQDPKQQQKLEQRSLNRLNVLAGQTLGLKQGHESLLKLPESVERDAQLISIAELGSGLFGAIKFIEQQTKVIEKNETYSSFDSELSLVFWPDYPIAQWHANVLHYSRDKNPTERNRTTIPVGRIDGPTVDLAKRLVDDAIAVENEGLKGKVYLDARGFMASNVRGSNGDYDESLRNLARVIEEKTDLEVVLDNKGELLQPGQAPEAALYCGWYSIGKYVDAFDWQKGAVGYHLASSEATTLRKQDSNAWCKRMIEDGVAATVGPTYEPYLIAFPKPDEFFCMLLSGEHTIAESYYRTKHFNSWVMTLIADPLYRPFKSNPQLTKDELVGPLQAVVFPEN